MRLVLQLSDARRCGEVAFHRRMRLPRIGDPDGDLRRPCAFRPALAQLGEGYAQVGVLAQVAPQLATEHIVQDAFGHRQAHQRLLPVKIGVALAVLDQALPGGLDDAALAGQREGVALMHEQMQAEALPEPGQGLAQQRRLDVQAARSLHETAATGGDQEEMHHLQRTEQLVPIGTVVASLRGPEQCRALPGGLR
nr:hypothetical protein [Pseudomonas aeruginosa]